MSYFMYMSIGSAYGSQKRVLDPVELESRVPVSHPDARN